jgi:hypothetical protein
MHATLRSLAGSLTLTLVLAACGAPAPEAAPGPRPTLPAAVLANPAPPADACSDPRAAPARRRSPAETSSRRSRGATVRAAPSDRGDCAQ